MTEGNLNNIYTLIGKYLSGEASMQEENRLQVWIDASSENRSEFEKMKKLWLASNKKETQSISVDVDQAWNKVLHKMEAEESSIKSISSTHIKPKFTNILLKIAAFFVFALTVYLLFKLSSGTLFQNHNSLASTDQILTYSLPDSSIVTLNNNSHISYNKNFKGKYRNVELEGEAFFKVKPNPSKAFVVQTKVAEVIVLGTSFNVRAYDSLLYIQVDVEEGRVKVLSQKDSSILKGGESIQIDKITGKLSELRDLRAEELYWKSNKLVFKNQRLEDVFKTLEKQYDIHIHLSNPKILDCRLTAKFNEEKIEQILEIIAANFNLELEQDGNNFRLNGDACE